MRSLFNLFSHWQRWSLLYQQERSFPVGLLDQRLGWSAQSTMLHLTGVLSL